MGEQIELKEGEEKKDESTEKEVKKETGPNCIDVISKDLNLGNRDSNNVNVEIDLDFTDVLAEPTAAQGFEWAWKLAFVIFSQTKLWIYKILSAVVAIPLALIWAMVFALLTVVHVWILSPALRLLDLILAVVKKVVVGVIGATLGPVCASLGLIFPGKSVQSPA